MTYLKHDQDDNGRRPKKRESKKQPTPSDSGDSLTVAKAIDSLANIFDTYVTDARSGEHNDYSGLSEVATQLEAIHKSLWSYNMNAVSGENTLDLFTGKHSYPMRLVLEGEAVEGIADSLKRIADAMAAHAK